jgi:hypothetical protein
MARIAGWVKANPDKYRAYASKWRRSRKEYLNLKTQMRRRRCTDRLPAWADKSAIRALYELAAAMTRETGIQHEVDHIIPLQGRTVCGLHCEANLRVVPMRVNRQKSNSWI